MLDSVNMSATIGSQNTKEWPEVIHGIFRSMRIRQVGYVPDSGHAKLIGACVDDPEIVSVPLTSEEEGLGLITGAWLGGQRGALLMQSSGVGNCMNMFTLATNCRIPVLVLVTMRGEWGEFNPWQVPMGQAASSAIELLGGLVYRVEDSTSVGPTVEAAAKVAFNTSRLVGVMLAQQLIGAKRFSGNSDGA